MLLTKMVTYEKRPSYPWGSFFHSYYEQNVSDSENCTQIHQDNGTRHVVANNNADVSGRERIPEQYFLYEG